MAQQKLISKMLLLDIPYKQKKIPYKHRKNKEIYFKQE